MALSRSYAHKRHNSHGFTLVEVLVAGVIMAAAMAAFARFNMVALANSRSQEIRGRGTTRVDRLRHDAIQPFCTPGFEPPTPRVTDRVVGSHPGHPGPNAID